MRHQRGTTTASETSRERSKTQAPWHRDPENPRNLSKSSLNWPRSPGANEFRSLELTCAAESCPASVATRSGGLALR